jgi:3-mercaptopyruvate sulfurtransferase SseA
LEGGFEQWQENDLETESGNNRQGSASQRAFSR